MSLFKKAFIFHTYENVKFRFSALPYRVMEHTMFLDNEKRTFFGTNTPLNSNNKQYICKKTLLHGSGFNYIMYMDWLYKRTADTKGRYEVFS